MTSVKANIPQPRKPRGNATPITSALLESLLTTPQPDANDTIDLPIADDIGVVASSDAPAEAPTGQLSPELHDEQLSAIQAKIRSDRDLREAGEHASDEEIAAATLHADNNDIPQPQTRLSAPAVKPYIPKPTPDGAILQPQPKPEDFVFPPPSTPPPAVVIPKPATRTSIAKRLSIQELLNAEMPQPIPPQTPEEK